MARKDGPTSPGEIGTKPNFRNQGPFHLGRRNVVNINAANPFDLAEFSASSIRASIDPTPREIRTDHDIRDVELAVHRDQRQKPTGQPSISAMITYIRPQPVGRL
jgi:hypothetical protein